MSYNEQASQGCCLVILQVLWCDTNCLSQLNTTYFNLVTNAKNTEKTKKWKLEHFGTHEWL